MELMNNDNQNLLGNLAAYLAKEFDSQYGKALPDQFGKFLTDKFSNEKNIAALMLNEVRNGMFGEDIKINDATILCNGTHPDKVLESVIREYMVGQGYEVKEKYNSIDFISKSCKKKGINLYFTFWNDELFLHGYNGQESINGVIRITLSNLNL